MFRKLFVSFLLTAIAAIVALQLVTAELHRREERSRERSEVLVAEARQAADAYERSGSAAAAAILGDRINLLDSSGASVVGRPVSNAETTVAATAARLFVAGFHGPFGDARNGIVAEAFVASSGRRFTLLTRGASSRLTWLPMRAITPAVPVAATLIVGFILSFVLARHFMRPLEDLATAANAVSEGRLDTRVASRVHSRSDEFGALARDFDRMTERIEALVTAERRMLADASHELRSPLARLNVALSLARQHPESDEHLDRIGREAQRLDTLIAELLTLARVDSGAESIRSRFSLRDLVQEIVADGDFEARSSNRRVELLSEEDAVIDGAAELVRSAVENVVRNAIRHTREGTAVEVALRVRERIATLSVRDHGAGVDEATLAEIFIPFRRGLGLAIADRIVRMHGGRIRATNAGGLLVEIELPLAA